MKQILQSILILNLICIITLVASLRLWQSKYGKLNEKQAALVIIGYLSFFTVTIFSPLLITFPTEAMLLDAILLLILWGVGYPWARWLYRRYRSTK